MLCIYKHVDWALHCSVLYFVLYSHLVSVFLTTWPIRRLFPPDSTHPPSPFCLDFQLTRNVQHGVEKLYMTRLMYAGMTWMICSLKLKDSASTAFSCQGWFDLGFTELVIIASQGQPLQLTGHTWHLMHQLILPLASLPFHNLFSSLSALSRCSAWLWRSSEPDKWGRSLIWCQWRWELWEQPGLQVDHLRLSQQTSVAQLHWLQCGEWGT